MGDVLAVRARFWTDYSQSFFTAYQFTVKSQVNTCLQILLGICFSFAAQSLSVILYRIYDRKTLRNSRALDPERTPLVNGQLSGPVNKRGRWARVANVAIVLVGWGIATGLVANVPSNNFGIANSQTCGVWNLKNNSSPAETDRDDLVQASKEFRAGYYARNCYSGRADTDPARCNEFAQSAINYKCEKAHCPFRNHEFCHGTYEATQCSTDWVDASALGINSRKNPRFKKTMTCTPLDMDAGFVDAHADEAFFDYYLGSFDGSINYTEYTFRQYGFPFKWGVPTYAVSAYFSSLYRESDLWKPLTPDLDRAPDTYLTVIFIVSARIFYTAPSTDYIFQARVPYTGTDYFYNDDPESHPLACVEQIQISASDGTIYPRIDKVHTKNDTDYEYVRSALRQSTVYDSIQSRGADALDAQEKVRDMVSLPLAWNQSAVESELLFATSLARIQYNVRDIAIGFGHHNISYVEETLPFARGKLCGKYKFPLPRGYTNINIVAYSGFFLVGLLLIVLGYGYKEFEVDTPERLLLGERLVFELLTSKILKYTLLAWSWTFGLILKKWDLREQNAGHSPIPNLPSSNSFQTTRSTSTQGDYGTTSSSAVHRISTDSHENNSSQTTPSSGDTLVEEVDITEARVCD